MSLNPGVCVFVFVSLLILEPTSEEEDSATDGDEADSDNHIFLDEGHGIAHDSRPDSEEHLFGVHALHRCEVIELDFFPSEHCTTNHTSIDLPGTSPGIGHPEDIGTEESLEGKDPVAAIVHIEHHDFVRGSERIVDERLVEVFVVASRKILFRLAAGGIGRVEAKLKLGVVEDCPDGLPEDESFLGVADELAGLPRVEGVIEE